MVDHIELVHAEPVVVCNPVAQVTGLVLDHDTQRNVAVWPLGASRAQRRSISRGRRMRC